jgi:hypothetical protein
VNLRDGRRKYVGYAVLIVVGLASFGLLPNFPRLQLSDGKPSWARVRNPHSAATALEERLATVASWVADREVSVRCADLDDLSDDIELGGVVQFSGDTPANYTRIRHDVCAELRRIYRDHGADARHEADAVEVLTHESFHLRGVKNEAEAECYALQFVSRVARRLGIPRANARLMQALAERMSTRKPPEYRSTECRRGGKLDLQGGWPPAA